MNYGLADIIISFILLIVVWQYAPDVLYKIRLFIRRLFR